MPAIISYLLGKFSLTGLWYAFYTTVQVVLLGFYISFTLWVIQMLLYVYNLLDSMFQLFDSAHSDTLGSQIFGLLDCMGVITGINLGLPVLLSAVSAVILAFVFGQMMHFYTYINSVVKGLKP